MIEPHITLTEPSTPKIFGQCCPVSSWGIRPEIRIRLSLLAGTHPLMAPGEDHRPDRMRFVTDVLVHEAIHQWQREITGATESSYHGHGPTFRAKATTSVRDDYYLRAYLPRRVPVSGDVCPHCRGTGHLATHPIAATSATQPKKRTHDDDDPRRHHTPRDPR